MKILPGVAIPVEPVKSPPAGADSPGVDEKAASAVEAPVDDAVGSAVGGAASLKAPPYCGSGG
jgi:hypothetical protein